MSKETGGPAFPVTPTDKGGQCAPTEYGMTLRQYAAIKLKVPDSGAEWLDEMIKESLRNDLAAKAMQGILADQNCCLSTNKITELSYVLADAMLVR